ncbi:MAG: carbohydrate ABC transporter permease [Sphaerochaeta sp.]
MNTREKKAQKKSLIIAIILAVIFLFPYYYILFQSFTPWTEVDTSILPHKFSLESYKYLITNGGSGNQMMWLRAMLNSIIVSVVSTGIALFTGFLIAYAMTQLHFRASKSIYNLILFQMFFPGIILLVPQYMLLRPLVNNYLGMIIPFTVSAWAVLMYYNYFKTLPKSVIESARIDGASEIRIAFQIAFPIGKTISIIVFLSIFLGRWSELMWDMLMAPKLQMQTLNVLITTQFKPMGNLPGPLYAASVILTFPVMVLFLCFSKYFKQGIAMQLK